jgi:hypothetical protein
MRNMVLFLLLLSTTCATAQTNIYTTANAHSHNDYQHEPPLVSAYGSKFGSIEVDIYLSDEELLVAHTEKDIPKRKKLEELYLKPLLEHIQANKGYIYEDTTQALILMVDIKSEPTPTLSKLVDLLLQYPDIINCKTLKILVSGNKPEPSTYTTYPSFIWFDGLLSIKYKPEELDRIAVLSDNFKNYTSWRGAGDPPQKDWETLQKAVARGHELGKKVRLWNTPDFVEGWQKILELGVDYIDTYSIKSLADYLKKARPEKK